MKRTNRAPARIPEPVTMTLPPTDYQPSKAELEEEFDMPGMTMDEVKSNVSSSLQNRSPIQVVTISSGLVGQLKCDSRI